MVWTVPRTWVAGETVTAAQLNEQLRDNMLVLGQLAEAWDPFTPTWTASSVNPAIGNGSLSGTYAHVGKLVMYRIVLTFGSTTTVGSGFYTWALPVSANQLNMYCGSANLRDDSAGANRTRHGRTPTADTLILQDEAGVAVGNATPFTWATGDTIKISGTYEAA